MNEHEPVEKFARLARKILLRDGEFHAASINLPEMGSIYVGLLLIASIGEDMKYITVSFVEPQTSDRVIVYSDNPECVQLQQHGLINLFLPMLQRRLLLESLADV